MIFLQNICLNSYLKLFLAVAGITIIAMAAITLIRKKTSKGKLKILYALLSVNLSLWIFDFGLIGLSILDAKSKGYVINGEPCERTNLNDNRIKLGNVRHFSKHSMPESKIKPENFDDLRGAIVIIYRFDCSDCHILYDEFKQLENVTFISSRTKLGEAFREHFQPELSKIPSGIYIRHDGKPVTLTLSYSDPVTESVSFDFNNWERLLNIQKQDAE